MKISYSILTHNETNTLEKLLKFLIKWKQPEDEIVILDDYSDDEKTKQILDFYVSAHDIVFEQRNLLSDYATQKNHLKSMCSGDYSFNLDADEMISLWLIKNIHPIVEDNLTIDLFFVPRINTVTGMTQEHATQWGYGVDENGWVNFPDWQGRVFRNRPNIRWEKKVHEQVNGFKTYSHLPTEKPFCILHYKTIDKQIEQNNFYNNMKI
jgi:glycosyltransferase involved in cell wall biosynthesis